VRPQGRPMRRKAFTLIEILTVIAIIAILVTLLTLGIRHLTTSGRQKVTETALHNLSSMLAARQMSGGVQDINQLFSTPEWTQATGLTGKLGVSGEAATLSASLAQQSGTNGVIVPTSPLGATVLVMSKLKAIPENARTIAALPADSVKSISVAVAQTNPPVVITAPILLDGWGHPILYVPPGGVVGLFKVGDNGMVQGMPAKTSPDGRGFWMSADADGYFGIMPGSNGVVGNPPPDADDKAAADDNLYSFES
jgi:prepilin-type N-terminal cleavage/methylation domain-containing protein